jgi:phosphoribosylformimino-5-aminoimidazole carboxamide ribonucleotide (ProFAR) isomerase
VVKTLARNESKQWSGLGQVMSNQVVRTVKAKGYKSMIHAFIIKQGTSRGTSEKFLGKVNKNYVLYGKVL